MAKRAQKVTRRGLLIIIIAIILSILVGGLMSLSLTRDSVIAPIPKTNKSTKPPATISSRVQINTPQPNNFGFSADELVWMNAAQQAQRLDDMKNTGISWVRIDMEWYVVQPSSPNAYDWSTYDRVINAITQHGLHALVILDYAPAWAARSGCAPSPYHKCSTADPASFATYAGAAANRYAAQGVTNWEIWNEPNTSRFWYPDVSVSDYTSLLEATYPAIKKANAHATVITGGLSSTPTYGDVSPRDFVNALYADGAQPYFDALGMHPYSYPSLPSINSPWSGWTQMLGIHDIAASHGDTNKKIWMTEVGAPTGGPHPVGERLQAQIAQQVVQLHDSYSWAGPLFWYGYQDLGANTSASEDFFGLVRSNGTHKLAYESFVQAIKK